MAETETLPRPTQTDIEIPLQRTEDQIEHIPDRPDLPEPGLGDFDLRVSRRGLSDIARLSGYLALGPRVHIRHH